MRARGIRAHSIPHPALAHRPPPLLAPRPQRHAPGGAGSAPAPAGRPHPSCPPPPRSATAPPLLTVASPLGTRLTSEPGALGIVVFFFSFRNFSRGIFVSPSPPPRLPARFLPPHRPGDLACPQAAAHTVPDLWQPQSQQCREVMALSPAALTLSRNTKGLQHIRAQCRQLSDWGTLSSMSPMPASLVFSSAEHP